MTFKGSTHLFLFNMFVKSGNADDHNQRGNDTTFMLALLGIKGASPRQSRKVATYQVTCLVNNIFWLGELDHLVLDSMVA